MKGEDLFSRRKQVTFDEPEKDYAPLGQIPREGLDLHVDPKGQRLVPNPDSADTPLSEMQ